MSKPTSLNGSESEFEFIETPKASPPSFEKEEDCGVRTTKVGLLILPHAPTSSKSRLGERWDTVYLRLLSLKATQMSLTRLLSSTCPSRMPRCPPTAPAPTRSTTVPSSLS